MRCDLKGTMITNGNLDNYICGLKRWLPDRLGVKAVEVTELRRPAVGQSSGTWLFDATDDEHNVHSLVLRTDPGPQGIFFDADVTREARVLEGLAQSGGVPVPRVIGVEGTRDTIGVPFFVMEQISGRVPQGKPSMHSTGWVASLSAGALARLWDSAMATLVAVHSTFWPAAHSFLVSRISEGSSPPAAFLERRLRWLTEWYSWTTKGREYPITDAGMSYLAERSAVVSRRLARPVLLWGDARVGNMVFDDDNLVVAALDWELATVGPPEIDLAHWLFFDEFATTAAGVDRLSGWPDRETTLTRYSQMTGREVNDLEYFDVMQLVFMATTLIRQSDRRVELGLSETGTRMGHDNTVTQMLASRLGLQVPDLSPDYLAHRGVSSAK